MIGVLGYEVSRLARRRIRSARECIVDTRTCAAAFAQGRVLQKTRIRSVSSAHVARVN